MSTSEPVEYRGTWSCEAGGVNCKVTMGLPPPPNATPPPEMPVTPLPTRSAENTEFNRATRLLKSAENALKEATNINRAELTVVRNAAKGNFSKAALAASKARANVDAAAAAAAAAAKKAEEDAAAAAAKKAEEDAAAAAKRQQRINNKNKDNVAKQNVGVGGLFGNNDNQNSKPLSSADPTDTEDTAITPFGPPVSRNSIKVPLVPLRLYENTRISDLFNNLNASKKGRLELFPEQRKRNLLGALIKLPVEVQQNYVTAFFNLTLEEQNRIFDKLQANPSLKMNELLTIKNEGGGRKRTRRGKRGGRGTRKRM